MLFLSNAKPQSKSHVNLQNFVLHIAGPFMCGSIMPNYINFRGQSQSHIHHVRQVTGK